MEYIQQLEVRCSAAVHTGPAVLDTQQSKPVLDHALILELAKLKERNEALALENSQLKDQISFTQSLNKPQVSPDAFSKRKSRAYEISNLSESEFQAVKNTFLRRDSSIFVPRRGSPPKKASFSVNIKEVKTLLNYDSPIELNCEKCGQEFVYGEMIDCSKCSKWFHVACTEYKPDSSKAWTCEKCT